MGPGIDKLISRGPWGQGAMGPGIDKLISRDKIASCHEKDESTYPGLFIT
jgi:hypothetical protein